jgi:caa(3)-type oxidase subunit IV
MAPVEGRTYVITWIGLLCLTGLSFASSVLKPSPVLETAIALGIATLKGAWVVLVFMHLLRARFADRLALVVGIFMLVLLSSLMLTDVLTRHTAPPKPLATQSASAAAP